MALLLYRSLLRLPAFKGRDRLIGLYRNMFFSTRKYTVLHGISMELDPYDWLQSEILRDKCLEPLTSNLYELLLRPGDNYVDVGAHVGFHTLLARKFVGATGRVVAIEPQPYNCQKIMANWRSNGFTNLTLFVAAVGEHDTSVSLHQQSASDTSRLSLCLEPVNDQPQVFNVPMKRLDTIFNSLALSQVRLLKIDVEGYELESLRGLGSYLLAIDNIILEVLDGATQLSAKTSALLGLLESNGYALRTVSG